MEENEVSSQVLQPTFDRSSSIERVASLPEDQAAMTIEFLRARLLSERSVSKAARQWAQQLAKKVLELEQRVEAEIQLRKKLEKARLEALSKHKGNLIADYGHLFVEDFERAAIDSHGGMASKSGSDVQLEHDRIENNEASTGGPIGTYARVNQDDDDDDGDDDDDMDQLAREKGILAWASRRGTRKLQDKEWGQGTWRVNRSFSQKSFGTPSPDRESHKRWIGKSVRQIRKKETRNEDADLEGDGEAEQGHAKDGLQSDEERDTEVERVLEHQTELIEQFEAEENAQMAWEEKFHEWNRSNNDSGKDQDAPRGTWHEKEEDNSITMDEQDIKQGSEIMHGAKLAEVDDCLSKQRVEDDGEPLEGAHSDNTGVLTVPLLVSHPVIPENNENSRDESVLVDRIEVSKVGLPGVVDDTEGTDTIEGEGNDMPSENQILDIAPDSTKGQNAPHDSDFIPRTSPCDLQEETPRRSIPTPLANPQEETLNKQLDVGGHLEADMVPPHLHNSRHLSSSFKFHAYPVSSSQGAQTPTEGASHQSQDVFSLYTESQEQNLLARDISRESSERQCRNQDYSQESVGRSQSVNSDNASATRVYNHRDTAVRVKFDSPVRSAHGKSSYDSSESLMNSSWEEIFKRRIRTQEASQVEQPRNFNSGSPYPHFHMDKQQHAHSFNTLSPMRAASHDHSVPWGYGTYQERRIDPRSRWKSADAGLDRVIEVLRALQIAKNQIESSNEHVIDHFGYPPQFIANANGSGFSSIPARGVEPYMHDMGYRHGATAVAAGITAGYARSPSRQSTNMEHAWRSPEPMPGQHTWSYHKRHGYPPYASQR